MPKVNIEDLTDEQLDHFCAIAQGWQKHRKDEWIFNSEIIYDFFEKYYPTTDAAQCMEIQEREKISVNYEFEGCWSADNYNTEDNTRKSVAHGTTAKQAIIRCFITSKLGDVVDCE